MKDYLQRHWVLTASVGTTLVAVTIFALVWFQPHKLFIEETVDEGLPGASEKGSRSSSQEGPSKAKEPKILAVGSFSSLEHETTGAARILKLHDGRRLLRFEDLETSNGPDLRVYLSEIPASDDWYAYGDRFIDLGALKGNRGNQNYQIPDELNLSPYKSAVIWCRRFTVGFGVAGLL